MPGATRDDTLPAPTASPASPPSPPPARRPGAFATTRWSVVLRVGRAGAATPSAHAALAKLCRTYWFPLYTHARRRGAAPHDAEDLTQAFFARLLARDTLARADPARGRFRTFILTALDRFLADEHDRTRAAKRGGDREILSLDFSGAEPRLAQLADPAAPPDRLFDRTWALALLDTVLARLAAEYHDAGKADLFAVLQSTLTAAGAPPYAELAARLRRSENAVQVAVHRLRQRYRALLRAEIAETVATDADARAEFDILLAALAS